MFTKLITSVNVLIRELKYLWNLHCSTCFSCVCLCSFSALWRVENAIYAHPILLLKDVYTKWLQAFWTLCSCCELKIKPSFSQCDYYKYAYWRHQPVHLSSIVSRIEVVLFCLLIVVLCVFSLKFLLHLYFAP
jgi:hypothetical protein